MTPLVGIVLVSHSAEIALGLRSLIAQIAQIGCGSVVVATAEGMDDGRTGTSCSLVLKALGTTDSGAG